MVANDSIAGLLGDHAYKALSQSSAGNGCELEGNKWCLNRYAGCALAIVSEKPSRKKRDNSSFSKRHMKKYLSFAYKKLEEITIP